MSKPNLGPWRYNCSYPELKKDHYITSINGDPLGVQVNQSEADPRKFLDEKATSVATRRYGPGKLTEKPDGNGFAWDVETT